MLSDNNLNSCEAFLNKFIEWLTNFRKELPVISDLNEQG
jgi:hypothetical protein